MYKKFLTIAPEFLGKLKVYEINFIKFIQC